MIRVSMKGISIGKESYAWGEEVFSLLSWFDFEIVKNAKVMVVGAGALGNEVLKNLALFGIGNIVIVDFDRIEYSNLCRSILFREEDARNKKMKAEVAAQRLLEINPGLKVRYINGDIGSDVGLGLIRKMDVVIGCLDSRLARYLINKHCFRANKTWIDGGIENLEGNVRIFKPGVNCYECSLNDFDLEMLYFRTGCPDIAKVNTSQGRVATTPISASLIGAIQTQEALKIIHGLDESSKEHRCNTLIGRMYKYDGMHLSSKNYKMSNFEDDCLSHELWEPVIEIKELSAKASVGETFKMLKEVLNTDKITINLMNNRFVYQLVMESTEKEIDVRLPESKVSDFIENNNLKKDPRERVFQKYYENIDENFPYLDLRLLDLGIPRYDILKLSIDDTVKYIELTGDEKD